MSLRASCNTPPRGFLSELSAEEQQMVLLGEDSTSEEGSSSSSSAGVAAVASPDKTSSSPRRPGSWQSRRSDDKDEEQSPRAIGSALSGDVAVAPLKPGRGAWVPPSAIGNLGMSSESKVVGSAKGILNKLTKLTFEKLGDELLDLLNKHPEQLESFVGIIFEKVCLEPTFCGLYAQLCLKLADEYRDGAAKDAADLRRTVLRVLLEKCQAEFESNAKADKEREAIRTASARNEGDGKNVVVDPEREMELEQRHRYKKLGNVTFLGELFRLGMVPEKTIHGCIIYLLRNIKNPLEEDVEHLCKLLSIAGKAVDVPRARSYVDQYFSRILQLSQRPSLPSRLRFMLQDVLALRASDWVLKRPRTEVVDDDLLPSPVVATRSPQQQPYLVEGGASVKLSQAEMARIKQEMRFALEEFLVSEDEKELVLAVGELKLGDLTVDFKSSFVYMCLITAMERGGREVKLVQKGFVKLKSANLLSASDFIRAWSKAIEELEEIEKDIVMVKRHLADFVCSALSAGCVSKAQFGILSEKHKNNEHCLALTMLVEETMNAKK